MFLFQFSLSDFHVDLFVAVVMSLLPHTVCIKNRLAYISHQNVVQPKIRANFVLALQSTRADVIDRSCSRSRCSSLLSRYHYLAVMTRGFVSATCELILCVRPGYRCQRTPLDDRSSSRPALILIGVTEQRDQTDPIKRTVFAAITISIYKS